MGRDLSTRISGRLRNYQRPSSLAEWERVPHGEIGNSSMPEGEFSSSRSSAPTPFTRIEEVLLLESLPHALVLSDTESRILLVNSRAESLFGYRQEELLGRALELLLPEGLPSQGSGRLTGAFDIRGRRKDGTIFPIEVTVSSFEFQR